MRGGAVSYCDSYKTITLHSFLLSALIALTSSVKVPRRRASHVPESLRVNGKEVVLIQCKLCHCNRR